MSNVPGYSLFQWLPSLSPFQTGIWTQASSLVKEFTVPLRRTLHATKMHAREEVVKKEQALMECVPQGEPEPVVTVEVSGERLPQVSPKDELQVSYVTAFGREVR